MPIFLARHASAVDLQGDLPDAARWLTAIGRREALATGKAMAASDRMPRAIWMSPLVRAVQTAELIAEGLAWTGELRVVLALTADEPASAAAALLEEGVLAVGHEPMMTMLARSRGQHITGFRRAQVLDVASGWTFSPAGSPS